MAKDFGNDLLHEHNYGGREIAKNNNFSSVLLARFHAVAIGDYSFVNMTHDYLLVVSVRLTYVAI